MRCLAVLLNAAIARQLRQLINPRQEVISTINLRRDRRGHRGRYVPPTPRPTTYEEWLDGQNRHYLGHTESTYSHYKGHVRGLAQHVDSQGKQELANLKQSLSSTRQYVVNQHSDNVKDHGAIKPEIETQNDQTSDVIERTNDQMKEYNPKYDDEIKGVTAGFEDWLKDEKKKWGGDRNIHEFNGRSGESVDEQLALLKQTSDINDMEWAKNIEQWGMKSSMPLLEKVEEQIKAYAAALPPVWFKKFTKYDDMVAQLDEHQGTIEKEVEQIQDTADDMVNGNGGLDDKTRLIERPFKNFWDSALELTEDFGERNRKKAMTTFSTLLDVKAAVQNALESLWNKATTGQELTALKGKDQMVDFLVNSKALGSDLRQESSGAARFVNVANGGLEAQAAATNLFEGSLESSSKNFAKKYAEKKGRVRKLAESDVQTTRQKLGEAAAVAAADLTTNVNKGFQAAATENLRVISDRADNYMENIMESNSKTMESAKRMKESGDTVKALEKNLGNQEANLKEIEKLRKNMLRSGVQVEKTGGHMRFSGDNAQQKVMKNLGGRAASWNKDVGDLLQNGRTRLNDKATEFSEHMEQESGDLLREVGHFSSDNIEEANMIKKEIILIENAMEESEMFLAKLMKEEKALIVRSNSTGEQVVKEAKEGNALSTAMEKLINDTAEERFGEHVKAVQEMSARMENMALQRINLRFSPVKNKINSLDDGGVLFDERLERQKAERAQWQEEMQNKITPTDVGMNKLSDMIKSWAPQVKERIEQLESVLAAESVKYDNRRVDLKQDGLQKVKKLVGWVRNRLMDVLAETGEGISEGSAGVQSTQQLFLDKMKNGIKSLRSRIAGSQQSGVTAMRQAGQALEPLAQAANDTVVGDTIESAARTLKDVKRQLTEARIKAGAELEQTGSVTKELDEAVWAARTENERRLGEVAKEAANETQKLRAKGAARDAEIKAAADEMAAGSEEKVAEMQHEELSAVSGAGAAAREADQGLKAQEAGLDAARDAAAKKKRDSEAKIKLAETKGKDKLLLQAVRNRKMANMVVEASASSAFKLKQAKAAGARVIAMLDTAGMSQAEASKITELQKAITKSLETARADVETAETSAENVVFNSRKTIEHSTNRVRKLQRTMATASTNVSKSMTELRTNVNDDEKWIKGMMKSVKDLTRSLRKHSQSRAEKLRKVHNETLEDLQRAVTMAKEAGSESLDGVLAELAGAIAADGNLSAEVKTVVGPQVSHWRKGIMEVFDHLGLSLSFESLESNAERRSNDTMQRTAAVSGVADSLDAIIHAAMKLKVLKLAAEQNKHAELVRQALRNVGLSTQERAMLVKRIKSTIQQETGKYLTKVRGTVDLVQKAVREAQQKTLEIKQVMNKSKGSMETFVNQAPTREDLRLRRSKAGVAAYVLKILNKQLMRQSLLEVGAGSTAGATAGSTAGSTAQMEGALQAVARGLAGVEGAVDREDAGLDHELGELAQVQRESGNPRPRGDTATLRHE